MAAADNRKHHWVPASYLRPWADANGLLEIERVSDGIVVNRFRQKPENILKKSGLYDMSALPQGLPSVPASFLETAIFAEVMEPAYLKTRKRTLDSGTRPTLSQAAFLAQCCIGLYFRHPAFGRMAAKLYAHETLLPNERQILEHHGVRTFALTVLEVIPMLKHCVFHFIQAVGTTRFWTCDRPCWMWYSTPRGWRLTRNLESLELLIHSKATATRWICPITPEWLLEICPLIDKTQIVNFTTATDRAVWAYNQAIRRTSEQLRIRPPTS